MPTATAPVTPAVFAFVPDGFYASCLDPNTDQGPAQVPGLTLPGLVTNSVSPSGKVISKFFAESAMLFMTSRVSELGFLDKEETVFGARWKDAVTSQVFAATLNLANGEYRTNAPNNFARNGLGLCGMGVALKIGSAEFRSAWAAFLADLATRQMDAMDIENTANIAAAIGDALERADPTKEEGAGWHLQPLISSGSPEQDLRDHFAEVNSFLALFDTFQLSAITGGMSAKFVGPQIGTVRRLTERRKHTALLGPPGLGKSLCAFEALALSGFTQRGIDHQVFTGHDEVKSADLFGAYQPTGEPGAFRWVPGVLVRAMTANDGRGQPLLIEEFTRMPRRAQNALITVLSDGFLVLNERPSDTGTGEIITAGPDFVLLTDMNVDPTVDDLDVYGAAFASRVRKVWFDYPSPTTLNAILGDRVPKSSPALRSAVAATYDALLKKWQAGEVTQPISPRDCVHWTEEIVDALEQAGVATTQASALVIREKAKDAAHLTWLRDVVGNDSARIKAMEQEIESIMRRAGKSGAGK